MPISRPPGRSTRANSLNTSVIAACQSGCIGGIIALETFVGEKERGTIEPLLVSPLKDWQLFTGKLIAGTAAPLFTSYLGITVYMIGLYLQGTPFPLITPKPVRPPSPAG